MSELTLEALAELVRAALAELGDTSDRVAETLRRADVIGKRDDACGCPVAIYLALRIPELRDGEGRFRWEVNRAGVQGWRGMDYVDVPIPDAVRTFIMRFDAREAYQELAVVTP